VFGDFLPTTTGDATEKKVERLNRDWQIIAIIAVETQRSLREALVISPPLLQSSHMP
jgi:hypothetical protein